MNLLTAVLGYNLLYIPISTALTLVSSITAVAVALTVPLIKGWNKFKKSKIIEAFGDEDFSSITVEDELVVTDSEVLKEVSATRDNINK